MTINIADNSPRISYFLAEGVLQHSFAIPFEFFDEADINVYVNGVLKTLTTDYTLTGGDGSTGTANISVVGVAGGTTVVITRDIVLERTTDFPVSGAFNIVALNTELDRLVAVAADLDDRASRSIQATDFDAAADFTLPLLDDRKGKILAFNDTTGSIEAGPSITDAESVALVSADIALLADIQDGTVDTNVLTNLNSIRTNITTTADSITSVNTVASSVTNVNNVASAIGSVTTVGGNITNVNTVAGISTAVSTVAANNAKVNTLFTNIGDIQTLANIEDGTVATTALSDLAAIDSQITDIHPYRFSIGTVAANTANISTVATNIANVGVVAGQTTNLQNVTDNLTAIQNAATNATAAENAKTAAEAAQAAAELAADNFDDTYLGSKSSDPTVDNDGGALNAGDLYFNTTSNTLRVYSGSAWQDAAIDSSGFVQTTGDTMTGNLDVQGTVTADGLTVDQGSTATLNLSSGAASWGMVAFGDPDDADVGRFFYDHGNNTLTTRTAATNRMQIAGNGDISFYEATGTTPKFFWDASAESLGIGTSSPAEPLHIVGDTIRLDNDGATSPTLYLRNTTGLSSIMWSGVGTGLQFKDSAGTERMRIDSSGNVGIGGAAETGQGYSKNLHVQATSTGSSLHLTDGTSGHGAADGFELLTYNGTAYIMQRETNPLTFYTSNTEAMRIDSSGNVGIGEVPQADLNTDYDVLQVGKPTNFMSSDTAGGFWLNSGAFFNSSNNWEYLVSSETVSSLTMTNATPFRFRYAGAGTAGNTFSWSEAMRIDSSGNLLVGKTTGALNTAGLELSNTGYISASIDGDVAAYFNRRGNAGDVVSIMDDQVQVGAFSTGSGGYMAIRGGNNTFGSGLLFGNVSIKPTSASGVVSDGAVDLGDTGARFKDLYLSGGVVFGSTGGSVTSKTLDDYEEGTWTPTLLDGADVSQAITSASGTYTKIGNTVHVNCVFTRNNTVGTSGNLGVGNLPFQSGTSPFLTGGMWIDNGGPSVDSNGIAYMGTNSTVVRGIEITSLGQQSSNRYFQYGNLTNGRSVYLSMTYQTS